MNLIINDYGVKLELDDELLQVSLGEKIHRYSFLKLSSINIMKGSVLTSPVLLAAAEAQVPVLLYGPNGKVEAWVWSHKYGNIAELRKQQVYFADSDKAIHWIREIVLLKIIEQIKNLKWLANRIISKRYEMESTIKHLSDSLLKVSDCSDIDRMRGLEGMASRRYWACIAIAYRTKINFRNRVLRFPKDVFNACLNYLYGILYGITESSLLRVGLDPYMGIYHSIQYNKPTLSYDLIEPFRPWADRIIMQLVLKDLLKKDSMMDSNGLLNLEVRKLLICNFFEEMQKRSLLNHKKIKKIDHIHYMSNLLVKKIRGEHGVTNDLLRH